MKSRGQVGTRKVVEDIALRDSFTWSWALLLMWGLSIGGSSKWLLALQDGRDRADTLAEAIRSRGSGKNATKNGKLEDSHRRWLILKESREAKRDLIAVGIFSTAGMACVASVLLPRARINCVPCAAVVFDSSRLPWYSAEWTPTTRRSGQPRLASPSHYLALGLGNQMHFTMFYYRFFF